ncbi:MAG: serine hydrolase domain-containing protein [bacterium]
MKTVSAWVLLCVGILIVLVSFGVYYLQRMALIGTAYKAKLLCSGVFISGRTPDSLSNRDLLVDDLSVLRLIHADVDYNERSVTASLFGLCKRKAIFREGLGSTLVIDSSEDQIRQQKNPFQGVDQKAFKKQTHPSDWLQSAVELPAEIDSVKFGKVIEDAFSEPDPKRVRRTRAVVVVYKGQIIAERYAEGFSSDTPLLGWSMTKSVINALVGILVMQGKLSLEDQDLLPEWRKTEAPGREITMDQLLRMKSGLRFSEDYSNPFRDAIFMLLGTGDSAAYAASKPPEAKPGSRWVYSSGTTNIISRIIRDTFDGKESEYLSFPRRALFGPIGMHSAVIEPDASGTFVGSSFMYATARDWARFGLLYLQDGIWKGERILPEGWVQYSTSPTPESQDGCYGAHFWLKVPDSFRGDSSPAPSLPQDMFMAAGHEGQFITIIPSRDLVVVRLGLSRLPESWDHEGFISQILGAIGDESAI